MKKWVCKGAEFKAGDKVRVLCRVESFDLDGMGEGERWDNAWTPTMTEAIGEIYVIESIHDSGAWLDIPFGHFGFPLTSLIHVEEGEL